MAAANWDEIRRLAADLQRAQLSSTIQRLSDRNCIELVNKVVKLKLVEVVFTTDGKEYVTPEQISREIRDELVAHRGRINLADLPSILCLDFSHIEARAHDLMKKDKSLKIVLGQLISRDYVDAICEEINERLQQNGHITMAEIIRQYDLPKDFIQEILNERLGVDIHGQADPADSGILFTELFVKRQRARVWGALMGITKPMPILNIINHHNFQERLFNNVANDLISSGFIAGVISGGRQERGVYIPTVYSKGQSEWVESFFKQNGYLEYDTLSRLGISEPASYIKKMYKNEQLTYLNSCAIGQMIVDQIDVAVDEAIISNSWVDILPILPSICTNEDANFLVQKVIKNRSGQFNGRIFENSIVCSEKFIQNAVKHFDPIMTIKAEKDAHKKSSMIGKDSKTFDSGDNRKDKKEERRKKAAGGKSGGGTQGRETKTRAVKKKYRMNKDSDDSDDEQPTKKVREVEFLTVDEIVEELKKTDPDEDCPEELWHAIAEHIHRPLTKTYQEVVQSIFLASAGATGADRRKTHQELQEKINGLLANVRMFEKGLRQFTGDVQTQLSKYLLKTTATDVTNLIFHFVAQENGFQLDSNVVLTNEIRGKILNNVSAEIRPILSNLNSSLNGKSVDDFFSAVENASGPGVIDVTIKKLDKKKERQVAFGHRQALLEQLSASMDGALSLHLAVLVLFQSITHCMLQASGKFVPQILAFLESHLTEDVAHFLLNYQGLVIKLLTVGNDEEQVQNIKAQLEESMPRVKEIAITTKKQSHSEQD